MRAIGHGAYAGATADMVAGLLAEFVGDAQETTAELIKRIPKGEGLPELRRFVFDLAGRVPAAGEIVKGLKGFDFEILQADGRQVQKLKIRRLRTAAARPPLKRKPAAGATDEEEKTG